MAYTPTTWSDGDLITAEKLNKLESGVQNEQVGPQGPKGETGAQGPQGEKGDPGETDLGVRKAILAPPAQRATRETPELRALLVPTENLLRPLH